MRALILTCDTGGGHRACASALTQVFEERGCFCRVADSLSFTSERLSRLLSWGHTAVYRHSPGLFQLGYSFAEKHTDILGDESSLHRLLTGGTEQLGEYILAGGYDTVICTHVFSAMLLGQLLRDRPMKLKSAFIATDYTCSPGAAVKGIEYCFIPHPALTEEFRACGTEERSIFPCGIPVRREFYSRLPVKEARARFGIRPDSRHLLMMCGSMGCGPMEALCRELCGQLRADEELTVVCGSNEKLRQSLERLCSGSGQVHVLGFTDCVSGLMDSADLYLTKPGGLSCSEAAVKRLPMFFVDAVAGCEEYNLRFFVSRGGADFAGDAGSVAPRALELLRDSARLSEMSSALESLTGKNAAHAIYSILSDSRE